MKNKSASKNNLNKFILGFFVVTTLFIVPVFSNTEAAVLNWENPNKTSGYQPYKFKTSDVLNSQLMMQVVGCTGVVDRVSFYLVRFTQSVFDTVKKATIDAAKAFIVNKICNIGKAAAEGTAGAAIDGGALKGGNVTNALKDLINCKDIQNTKPSTEEKARIYDQAQKEDAQRRAEQCFNGIAYTLAKNQLTSMARYTLNWVNTGFGGDPFFVQNTQSFLTNIERGVFEQGINMLMPEGDGYYPYSQAFSRAFINQSNFSNTKNGALGALSDLTSTMVNFVTDPNSYLSDKSLSKLERAKRANELYEEDFMNGGWDAWFAFTQNDANNPLGYSLLASEIITQQKEEKIAETKNEISENSGFLSQKKCVEYAKPIKQDVSGLDQSMQIAIGITNTVVKEEPVCIKWKVVTPGSLIKDKVNTYLNSPERQLELADDINSILNSVFSNMLSRFADKGLIGITAEKYQYTDSDMMAGETSNFLLGKGGSSDGNYSNGTFDLTRDLGNRFIYNYTKDSYLGKWDAEKNYPKLVKNTSPVLVDSEGNISYPSNVYYEVSAPGKTKLFDDGYSGWAIGDRAFWDGEKWQNWKVGSANPIYKRGVIQIQKDYVVAAKEMLQNLPAIMPKLGELDYCIPGPNLGWNQNYGDAVMAFSDYAYSLSSTYATGSLFTRDATTFEIAKPGDEVYDNYKNIFADTTSMWPKVQATQTWLSINNLAKFGTQKRDFNENGITDQINKVLNSINEKIPSFREKYTEIINGVYGPGGLIQTPTFMKENTEELEKNTAYLAVAEVATPITQNITQYDEDIKNLIQEYKDGIIQANSNIYKLQGIKDKVSTIIKAAQARRDSKMIEILNNEAKRTGGKVLTIEEYKDKYADCLEEEDIVFYDDLEIMRNTTSEAERCTDGLDNDLDGLTDSRDPDCVGTAVTNSGESVSGDSSRGGTAFGDGDTAFGDGDKAFENTTNYLDREINY